MANQSRFSEEKESHTHAMPSLSQTPTVHFSARSGRVDVYIQEIRHEAHRRLDAGRAEALVAEVAEHLTEAVDTQIHDGITQDRAERNALAGFDSARKFVRRVAASTCESRPIQVVRNSAFLIGAISLMISVSFVLTGVYEWHDASLGQMMSVLSVMGILALAIGSFVGRRSQWRRYTLLATVLVLLSGFVSGYREVVVGVRHPKRVITVDRTQLNNRKEVLSLWIEDAQQDIALLKEGLDFYLTANRPLPSRLLVNGKFIVPRSPAYADQTAFRRSLSPHWVTLYTLSEGRQNQRFHRQQPFLTVSNQAEAYRRWYEDGSRWWKLRRRDLRLYEQHIEACNIVAANPWLFNWHGAWAGLGNGRALLAIPLLVALHLFLAHLGKLTWRNYCQWIWRIRRTA